MSSREVEEGTDETPRVLDGSGNHSRRRHGETRKSNEAEWLTATMKAELYFSDLLAEFIRRVIARFVVGRDTTEYMQRTVRSIHPRYQA